MQVVYLEDDDELRELAALILDGDPDLTLHLAADAPAAEAHLRGLLPVDVLLLDAGLPGEDGPAFVRRLRADPDLAALTIVFLTGRSAPEDAAPLRAAGADEVLVKPFRLDLLPQTLDEIRRRRDRLNTP